MGNLSYTLKEHFHFTPEELRAGVISILLMAFMFSFDEWGTTTFNVTEGLRNFFNATLIVTLSFLVHQSAQRIAGLADGFKVEYRIWMYGLIFGLALSIISRGQMWILAPGGILVYHLAGHRIGSFRYGLNYWPMGVVALMGPLSNILLAIFFKLLLLLVPTNVLIQKAIIFNLWFAFFTLLPIPPLDGSHLFWASRLVYIFALGAFIGIALTLYFLGVFLAVIIGLVLGIGCWLAYYIYIESG